MCRAEAPSERDRLNLHICVTVSAEPLPVMLRLPGIGQSATQKKLIIVCHDILPVHIHIYVRC